MATGRSPWAGFDIESQIKKGTRPYTVNQIDPHLFEIMEKSWQQHPKNRIDISKVLRLLKNHYINNHFNELYGIELFRALKISIELVDTRIFEAFFMRLIQFVDIIEIKQYIKTLSHLDYQMNQIAAQITNPFTIAIMKFCEIGFKCDTQDVFKSLNACNEDLAHVCIGICYFLGTGIEMDESEALKCFKKASDANVAAGHFCFGTHYTEGYGCEIDYKEAFKYYEMAAESHYSTAFHHIGYFYNQGLHVAKNDEKALEYYKLGAKYGSRESCYNVGRYYHYGRGCEKNEVEAMKYYEIALELGDTDAKDQIDKVQNASNTNCVLQ
eukprot:NODE_367_length_8687_cov_0.577084.p1 type:complete len:326 gc:universal NODE_367_length_8687_cov_0.577084:4012-4989(+)